MSTNVEALLGDEADDLLTYEAKGIATDDLTLPGPDFIDRVLVDTDRSPQVLRNLQSLLDGGRLAGSGYVSILPVDQGIEHSAAASFAPNPMYFDPRNVVELALEGGCNGGSDHSRSARHRLAAIRTPDPVHRQAQPQPASHLPQHVRPDHVQRRAAGVRSRRSRRRSDDLLRF